MKLVRDKIPQLDTTGVFTYRRAKPSEIKQLLENKLREEVEEFLAHPCLDEYVDVADIFAQVALFNNLIGTKQHMEHVMAYTRAKADKKGQFTDFWIQETTWTPEDLHELADPMHLGSELRDKTPVLELPGGLGAIAEHGEARLHPMPLVIDPEKSPGEQ
jgi:predicted house-cleaning noncanonical NTP pyrophosphatase (MazG superfamily)